MLRLVSALLLIFMLTGCDGLLGQLTRPVPYGLADVPDGPPEFRQGWRDGCDTGIGAYGDSWYKAHYTFKQDVNLINNPLYYRAWRDAYTHCRWYTQEWNKPWA